MLLDSSIARVSADSPLVMPGTDYIDPVGWDPLMMKFCEFFGGGMNVHPSSPATAWRLPRQ